MSFCTGAVTTGFVHTFPVSVSLFLQLIANDFIFIYLKTSCKCTAVSECCKHFSINIIKGVVRNHALQSELFISAFQSQDTVSPAVKELQISGRLFAENLGESSELNT